MTETFVTADKLSKYYELDHNHLLTKNCENLYPVFVLMNLQDTLN